MGGIAKMEVANVQADVQDLGAGEPLDGYQTYKYRITQSYTMNVSVMGRTISTPGASRTDVWIAPQLDGLMDPSARTPGDGDRRSADVPSGYTKVEFGDAMAAQAAAGRRGRPE